MNMMFFNNKIEWSDLSLFKKFFPKLEYLSTELGISVC